MSSGSSRATVQGLFHAGDRAAAFVVAVGDPEGVGSRAVADDLAVDPCAPGPGVLELFEDQHAGPFAQDEAVAIAVEGAAGALRARRCGSKVRSGRMKPVTPKGWIMLCVPPERITSALPRRISSKASPMACELAAQAVRQLALGPLAPKTLARWPDGVPGSCSASRIAMQLLDAQPGELGRVDAAVARASGAPG